MNDYEEPLKYKGIPFVILSLTVITINIILMCTLRASRVFGRVWSILFALATADTLNALGNIFFLSLPHLMDTSGINIFGNLTLVRFIKLGYGLANVSLCWSVLLNLMFAIDRFHAIAYPLRHKMITSGMRIALCVTLLVISTIIFGSRFFEYRVKKEKYEEAATFDNPGGNHSFYLLIRSEIMTKSYKIFQVSSTLTLIAVLPTLILIALGVFGWYKMSRLRSDSSSFDPKLGTCKTAATKGNSNNNRMVAKPYDKKRTSNHTGLSIKSDPHVETQKMSVAEESQLRQKARQRKTNIISVIIVCKCAVFYSLPGVLTSLEMAYRERMVSLHTTIFELVVAISNFLALASGSFTFFLLLTRGQYRRSVKWLFTCAWASSRSPSHSKRVLHYELAKCQSPTKRRNNGRQTNRFIHGHTPRN